MEGVHAQTMDALDLAKMAYDAALMARDEAEGAQTNLTGLLQAITDFIEKKKVTPAEIQQVAQMALETRISLTPEEIRGKYMCTINNMEIIWKKNHGRCLYLQSFFRAGL